MAIGPGISAQGRAKLERWRLYTRERMVAPRAPSIAPVMKASSARAIGHEQAPDGLGSSATLTSIAAAFCGRCTRNIESALNGESRGLSSRRGLGEQLPERLTEAVECGGQLAARGAGRLVPATANVALAPTRGISASMCTRALSTTPRRDNHLELLFVQATVLGGRRAFCMPDGGSPRNAAPSEAARNIGGGKHVGLRVLCAGARLDRRRAPARGRKDGGNVIARCAPGPLPAL